jgi:hypothetical protein
MVHIRRKFVDVFQAEGSVIAEEAIKRIAGLYACSASAPMRHLGLVEEWRISGSA